MAEQKPKTTVIRFGKFKWVAAAFIFGVIAGMCVLSPLGSQGLFESNFTAHEEDLSQSIDMGLSTRGANTPKEVTEALRRVRKGLEHYNAKEYSKAIDIFEAHLKNDADKYDPKGIKFYLGVSYLATEKTEKAQAIFEELIQLEKFNRKEDTQWYLALTYIKAHKPNDAKPLLTALAQDSRYKSQAENLLKGADQPQGPKKERPVYFR